MDEWLDYLVRRVALEVTGSRQFKGTLVCTSYDPKSHAVKGIIVPHGIETGFVPLQAIMTSGQSGTGMFIGPTPGSAEGLDGDRLDIEFDMGDPNTIVAKHKMSQPQNPPQVQSGEHLVQHEKGSSTLYKQDGSIIQTHFAKQGTASWDANGNHTLDTKGANVTIQSGDDRGKPQKIGGNMALSSPPMIGVVRGMATWNDLTARELIAAGTATNLYAVANTDFLPVDITPAGLVPGFVDPQLGFGWGADTWGSGTFGTPRLNTSFQTDPRIWSLDNFGKLLIACPSDDTLYSWDPTVSPIVPAAAVSGAPQFMRGFYITEERFIIAFGTTGPAGESQNLMRIYWCAQGVQTDWDTTHTPTELANLPGAPAGSRQLQIGTKIVAGSDVGNFTSLIWTDSALYTHQYTGSAFTFDTQLVGRGCGLLSRYGFVVAAGVAYWMSGDTFWMYAGGSLMRIPNAEDISDWFFNQARADDFSSKSFAYYSSRYAEIWFVVVPQSESEPSLAAIYNIQGEFWFKSTISPRSAATAFSELNNDPILAGADGVLYQHEDGVDDNGAALPWSLSTGLLEIDSGAESFDVFGFEPDMERQIGQITIAMTAMDRTPTATIDAQSNTFGPTDGQIDFRLAGREVAMTLSGSDVGCDFRLGKPKIEFQPAGGRR